MENESHSTFLLEFHTDKEKSSSPDGWYLLLYMCSKT